jgi:hypothetical protein
VITRVPGGAVSPRVEEGQNAIRELLAREAAAAAAAAIVHTSDAGGAGNALIEAALLRALWNKKGGRMVVPRASREAISLLFTLLRTNTCISELKCVRAAGMSDNRARRIHLQCLTTVTRLQLPAGWHRRCWRDGARTVAAAPAVHSAARARRGGGRHRAGGGGSG